MNVKRGIAQRKIAQMKQSIRWKIEPVQAPSRTHADVESEQAGEKLEYV